LESEHPYLEIKNAEGEKKISLHDRNSWTIGRSPENGLVFDDDAMSRRHALIQQPRPGKFYLIDLGSRNGSSLNGQRIITSVELHDGDLILCGGTTMLFHGPTGEAEELIESSSNETGELTARDSHATILLYEKRLITVLVVDIRGFTQLAQKIDEALLAESMGTWFRELGSMLQRSGCSTDKYIGDAAMAVWVHEGHIPNQKEIRRVLDTLLKIQEFTSSLHERFSFPSPLRMGAGINTGLSVMGNSGPLGNPDFSPLGESVNAAFRLETATKNTGFDVALGRLTFECLSGAHRAANYFEKRLLELKGYDKPVEAWLISYSQLSEFLATGD
jgi:adenylate cyclase